MSVEQHQSMLFECYQSIDNYPDVQFAIKQANDYTEMMKSGQLSSAEYVELMEDIQRQINIVNSVSHQQFLTNMNTAINGLISLAKLV